MARKKINQNSSNNNQTSSSSSSSNSNSSKSSSTSHPSSNSISSSIKRQRKLNRSLYFYPALFFFCFFFFQLFLNNNENINLNNQVNSYLEQFQSILSSQKKYPPSLSSKIILKNYIENIQWNYNLNSNEIINKVIQNNKPIIFRKGPVIDWPLTNWNLLDTIKSGNDIVMEGFRWQSNPVFTLGRDRDQGGMLGNPNDNQLLYINTTLSIFLKTMFNTSEYFYWNGELSWIEEVTGTSATRPNEKEKEKNDWTLFKYIDPELKNSIDEDDDLWIPMVWLSHPGVVSQTHYDPQHNFLSQIQGSKRVILFPPNEQSIYLYPHIHRSYRQSQLHLEIHGNQTNPDSNLFPTLPTTGIEVVLHPGDTLYIPPYWYHRVESLTMSISISVTSPTIEEAKFSEIYWQSLPFGKFSDSIEGRKIAAKLYLGLLVTNMNSQFNSLESMGQWIYNSRYLPLYPPNLISKNIKKFNCPKFPKEGTPMAELVQQNSDAFQTIVKKTIEKFDDIKCDLEIKRNFMADYIEEISRWAVGPDGTVYFIKECLK